MDIDKQYILYSTLSWGCLLLLFRTVGLKSEVCQDVKFDFNIINKYGIYRA